MRPRKVRGQDLSEAQNVRAQVPYSQAAQKIAALKEGKRKRARKPGPEEAPPQPGTLRQMLERLKTPPSYPPLPGKPPPRKP
ncbi:hypothetical protein SAMN05877831_104156 [Rhodobacter maris]|uniref:Uncharacterized protein n=1 Tax=Rhodobacter maris TaxID=446682 RepID=A0A285SDX5_9RHOB|nr:hypothetical protein SAMN05877831_104156 [Rhodobacter maris]